MFPEKFVEELRQAWSELRERQGSLADAPLPYGLPMEELLPHLCALEQEALRVAEAWIGGEPFPPLPPGLKRFLEFRFYAAFQLSVALSTAGCAWTIQEREPLLRWLLIETYATTTQDVLDNALRDILACGETP